MIKPISPCKNCEDRDTGCHASCERYLTWKGQIPKAKPEDAAMSFVVEGAIKRKKRYGRSK